MTARTIAKLFQNCIPEEKDKQKINQSGDNIENPTIVHKSIDEKKPTFPFLFTYNTIANKTSTRLERIP